MKKFLGIVFVLSSLVATPALAQMGMMGRYSNSINGSQVTDTAISTALEDIYKAQNVSTVYQINCSKVSDDQFEKLGDAYMGYGITEAQHTAMENMMGGEGSATLKIAHINMGRAYLGCWSGFNSNPVWMPMMSYYGTNFPMGYGHMGFYSGNYGFGWVTTILVWVLLGLAIAAIVKWLKK